LNVRRSVASGLAFGLGLRLGRRAADELCRPARLDELRRFLAEHDLYVFTINGFPYGDFHDTSVKEQVYAPDWRSRERLDYTKCLADILAALLPENVSGSISTVPGSYRQWVRTDDDMDRLVRNLAECAAHLSRIEAETGQHITLALEPEPDCLFDTTAETVAFFNTTLAQHPALNATGAAAWRRYLGVCLDACHLSVQFEDPATSLLTLRQNGIAVPKVHLSAALRAPTGAPAAAALRTVADTTYLHQVRVRCWDQGILRFPDLADDALDAVARQTNGEVRVHVHVPLYFEESEGLRSTAGDLCRRFFRTALNAPIPHLEIETYTFNVLPANLADRPIEESIAQEYRWVLERIAAVAGATAVR
jgi:sugar phosphate isomerase/epimerase